MKTIIKTVAMLALLAPFALSGAAMAQEAEDEVIATVNGYDIRTSEVALAADDLLPQLGELPAQTRYPFIVQYLIERHLLAQVAEQQDIAETPEFERRLSYYRAKALRDAYFVTKLRPTVTEEEARAIYERESASVGDDERVRARHILVDDEATARQIIAELQAGADFAELAKKHSTDPGAGNGGDLGFFARNEMVENFSNAAFALQPGQISEPVQTQFGWHVIKVEDRQMPEAKPFEEIKEGLIQLLQRQRVQEAIQQIQAESTIVIHDEDLQKLRLQQEQQGGGDQ